MAAPLISSRATGARPAMPSSPMPTMDSQRRGAAICGVGGKESAASGSKARPMRLPLRVLILGGTTEARQLAGHLASRAEFAATLSLAGRTAAPAAQPVPVRVGGFGGAA